MPLTFDMPLEKLKTYNGISPCPKDFDKYWERALKEMHSLGGETELVPSDFTTPYADCFDMYFTGVRGARIHAKLLKPKGQKKPAPAIVIFHGLSGNAGDWYDKLPYVAMGYTVAAMDCRGQGGLSEDTGNVKGNTLQGHIIRGLDDNPDNMLYRHIFLDAAQLAEIVMNMKYVDKSRVGVTGGSQGGAITLACTALVPEVKLAAPVYPYLCDYKRVWEMDQAKDAYLDLHMYFKRFDPLHQKEDEVFEQLGYIDVQHLCKRIKAEVMMAVGLMDTICPPSTQFSAYNKIKSKKSLLIYPDFGHEGLPESSDRIFQFFRKL